ncbi:MAG: KH domain-containing protein [Tissierellia bacterium]|jgi:predicted RNA-binding protein YlqC (UPF0109 family)|nr:KH domain-containing protein [Bacillota bacterium]NLK57871.1 KH domain-containing protein [Tissierellia bacterium]
MEQIVTTIAKELVEYPEHVSVTAAQDAQLVYITLRVDPRDMGKVIGKRGRIAKAFRTLLKAVAMNDDRTVHLDIQENEGQVG